jgi:hypothetical protein
MWQARAPQSSAPEIAPPDTSADGQWRWTAAMAGGDVYIGYRVMRQDGGYVSAWIDRRFSDNQAGIKQDVLELRQFNCSAGMVRRLFVARQFRGLDGRMQRQVMQARSAWSGASDSSSRGKLLTAVCGA